MADFWDQVAQQPSKPPAPVLGQQKPENPTGDFWDQSVQSQTASQPPHEPTWSEKIGIDSTKHPILEPIVRNATDVAEGVASGAASTLFHGGDIIRRGLGMQRVIDKPEVQHAMTAPPTTAGTIGKVGEQTAEFLAPAGLIGKAGKAVDAAAAGLKAAAVARVLGKSIINAVAGGGVAGVQTGGDPVAMRNAALAAGGTSAVTNAVGEMLPTAQKAAERMYGSALKPPPSMDAAERRAIINTGLREGIVLDDGVVENVQKKISELNDKIAEGIKERSAAGATVDPTIVAKTTDRALNLAKTQVNPDADVAAVNNARKEFLENHSTDAPYSGIRPGTASDADVDAIGKMVPSGENGVTKIPQDIPLGDAQKLKTGTYRKLKDSYGEQASASREAQKDLARGLKEEIVKAFPEIANLNAKESALLRLESSLERFAGREGNKQLIGLGTPMAASAAHAMGAPVIPLTLLKAALEMPSVKSRLAIALAKAARAPGVGVAVSKAAVRAVPAVAAYSTTPPQQYPNGMMLPPQ